MTEEKEAKKFVHWRGALCILGEYYEGGPNDDPRSEDPQMITCPVCRLALGLR